MVSDLSLSDSLRIVLRLIKRAAGMCRIDRGGPHSITYQMSTDTTYVTIPDRIIVMDRIRHRHRHLQPFPFLVYRQQDTVHYRRH